MELTETRAGLDLEDESKHDDPGGGSASAATKRAIDRISVTAPYFAFDDLALHDDGTVEGTVQPVTPGDRETGAIEAAQVARHLAIIGSCSAALQRDDDRKHHYLAIHAEYERSPMSPRDAIADPCMARGLATWTDKRTATAETELIGPDGAVLNRLRVTYAVMAPRMFDRLNPMVDVPATEMSLGETLVIEQRGVALRDCGPVPTAMCEGHFPGRPAAPVALLMGRLVATAADAMFSHLDTETAHYRVDGGTVEATRLAQAGQHLVLRASHEHERDGTHHLRGIATADEQVVGTVEVQLSAHED